MNGSLLEISQVRVLSEFVEAKRLPRYRATPVFLVSFSSGAHTRQTWWHAQRLHVKREAELHQMADLAICQYY